MTQVSRPDPSRMVGLGGFEPPTRSLGNCCSIHLSYSPQYQTTTFSLHSARWVSSVFQPHNSSDIGLFAAEPTVKTLLQFMFFEL